MTTGDPMDLTLACQSFPGSIAHEIPRDNILDTIELIFDGDSTVVVVEGAQGIGKTSLLRQFALRHCQRSISLFISPHSMLTYNPDLLSLDLCNQITWA